jgi:multicomponent Na+:H+ antiporter subunit F
MFDWQVFVAVGLLLALAAGFIRAIRGPSSNDRLTGLLFSGTSGVALLLFMSIKQSNVGILDAALVFVVLAPILTLALLASVRPSNGRAS